MGGERPADGSVPRRRAPLWQVVACVQGGEQLNYRHAFHAGNFADVAKHALLLALLSELTVDAAPLEVLDTHAGAGVYDLRGDAAQRSGEAAGGVGRLYARPAPAALVPLQSAVSRLNGGQALRFYPGSPWLAVDGLRPGDRYRGCELRVDDYGLLTTTLGRLRRSDGPVIEAAMTDGFIALEQFPTGGSGRTLVVIDPPYESGDDYARLITALEIAKRRRPSLTALIWAPLKDVETLDALLRGLEGLGFGAGLCVEIRLRPPANPLRLNGCALILLGGDASFMRRLTAASTAISAWAAEALGDGLGRGRVEQLFR